MKFNSKLLGLLLAGATAATIPACSGSTRVVAVARYEEPPPPMREEYVTYRPGYVWVHGNWYRGYDNRWAWRSGYYVRERPGYVYAPGRWERRGRQYIWIDGGWRASGSVVIRRR